MHDYCYANGLHFVASSIRHGNFFYEDNFQRIASYENTVVYLEELGVFMNSRNSMSKASFDENKDFFFDLVFSGKARLDLLWNAQDLNMVDLNVRRMTNFYYHTMNTNPSRPKNGKPDGKLRMRIVTKFDADGYDKWLSEKSMKSWVKNRADWRWGFFDQNLFKAFNTFFRADKSEHHSMDLVVSELQMLNPQWTPKAYEATIIPADYRPGMSIQK